MNCSSWEITPEVVIPGQQFTALVWLNSTGVLGMSDHESYRAKAWVHVGVHQGLSKDIPVAQLWQLTLLQELISPAHHRRLSPSSSCFPSFPS
jgi:hypothetical protein